MARATLTLRSGTTVVIEGSVEEVDRLLTLHESPESAKPRAGKTSERSSRTTNQSTSRADSDETVDVGRLVNSIKDSDDWERIEERVLNQTGRLARVLLPLYACTQYADLRAGLTSGDIAKVTRELNVPLSVANASTTLAKQASRYVIADGLRRKGRPVRYTLHRRGIAFFEEILTTAKTE